MLTKDVDVPVIKRPWISLPALLLAGCAPLGIMHDIGHDIGGAYQKDEALWKTQALSTFNRMGKLSQHLKVKDWDEKETDFHYVWRPAAGADTTFVFVHGYPDSLFTWTKIIAPRTPAEFPAATALASRANLLAMDLPGHGFTKSKRSTKELTPLLRPDGAAKSVVSFLEAGGVTGKVVLVGHSFGGLVSLYTARQATLELSPAPLPLGSVPQPRPVNRRWQVVGLVLIDPEGAPRKTSEYLESETMLREGFLGRASGSHFLARWCGWFFEPKGWLRCWPHDSFWRIGYWGAQAEHAIQEVYTNGAVPNVVRTVPCDQRKAYAILMRVKEDYLSNRTLVRRHDQGEPGEHEIISWAGTNSVSVKRSLIWGAQDEVFPLWTDSAYYNLRFRSEPSLSKPVPGAGHLVPGDKPEEISTTLLAVLDSLHR